MQSYWVEAEGEPGERSLGPFVGFRDKAPAGVQGSAPLENLYLVSLAENA